MHTLDDTHFSYEAAFRTAYPKGYDNSQTQPSAPLSIAWFESPLGPLITVSDDAVLYMLEFTSRKNLGHYVNRLQTKTHRAIMVGRTQITGQIETELTAYFAGKITDFTTPLHMIGTDFQQAVWNALRAIPYGQTRSYSELAKMISNDSAVRAAASSNANNTLALIVPCHRVISKSGELGGYAGGLVNKQWLLNFEAGRL